VNAFYLTNVQARGSERENKYYCVDGDLKIVVINIKLSILIVFKNGPGIKIQDPILCLNTNMFKL